MSELKFNEKMREISGFGLGYEETCRKMVIAGAEWLQSNPGKNIEYKTFKNVYGITTDENADCKELEEIMLKASGNDCTGAMMQACLSHTLYIQKNGWDEYVKTMEERT